LIELLRRLLADPVPEEGTKFIALLGNPGAQYSTTRHNVAWWLADRLVEEWAIGRFRKDGPASVAAGHLAGRPVQLLKPLGYMNRSGQALHSFVRHGGFQAPRDLMVVVDDVALEPGRARMRPEGSAGGHNGLKSIEAALGTREYPRLRIGVGSAPPGEDLAEWVLSSPPPEERRLIRGLFPQLTESLRLWVTDGLEPALRLANSAAPEEGSG
jgi:peptidyl-tRNA hydrolase, PTH1 family